MTDRDDESGPSLPLRWDWSTAHLGLSTGAHVGAQVGGWAAAVFTLITLVWADFSGIIMGSSWICCLLPFGMLAALLIGGGGGAVVGLCAGTIRAVSGHVGYGMLTGAGVGFVAAVPLLALWIVCFPQSPRHVLLLPLGTALGIWAGGVVAGIPAPQRILRSGQSQMPGQPHILRELGIDRPGKASRPVENPQKPPQHPEGIRPGQEGIHDRPEEREDDRG